MILIYDGGLKVTPFGPLGMGACRTLNVFLGMSPWLPTLWNATPSHPADADAVIAATALAGQQVWWQIALANGVYITGVTWLARNEAGDSGRRALIGATVVVSGTQLARSPANNANMAHKLTTTSSTVSLIAILLQRLAMFSRQW